MHDLVRSSAGGDITEDQRYGDARALNTRLNEQTSITPEMAVRLGKYCGNGPEFWLRLQLAYDLWQAEAALERELKAIPDRSRSRIKQLSRESKARIGSKRWNRGDLHKR